jgi:hypothetical protein
MTPPRLARRLLAWLTPPELRDAFLDDLDEAFARQAGGRSRWRRSLWYWREALAGLPSMVKIRLRRASSAPPSEGSGMTIADTLAQDRLLERSG